MAGPMTGVRVVELGVWVAGPAAAGMMADWGADVIKVESTGLGDPARGFGKMIAADLDLNPPFETDNRSKRSIALDLSQPKGLEVMLQLIDEADVFITNIRASALERMGLGIKTLQQQNPRLIYAIISGYGLQGPDADRAAYDIAAYWARSGIAWALTPKGANPPFQRGGMGDHGTAMALVGAISASLYEREKSNKGQLVSASILRYGLYTISFDLSITCRMGVAIQPGKRESMINPAINNYRTKDDKGFWIVGLEADRHWPPLTVAVGHTEWQQDTRFDTAQKRAQNATLLIALLDEVFATKTRDEWAKIFDNTEDFFWAPIQAIDEVINDPQVRAGGGLVDVPDGDSTTTLPATPVDFDRTAWAPRWMAPTLGQHTEEILAELGFSDGTVKQLRQDKIVE